MKKLKKIKLLSEHSEALDITPIEVNPEESEERDKREMMFLKKIFKNGKSARNHIKPIPWRVIFSGRNVLIVSCVALIGIAGYMNVKFYSPNEGEDIPTEKEVGGDILIDSEETEDYYSVAVINRERVRDEAIDTLREITESESSSPTDKEEAYNKMSRLADESTYEVNIENLVRAKGFNECVAVISDETANIIVTPQSESLTESEVAQIKEIVYEESGVLPTEIKIIEKN